MSGPSRFLAAYEGAPPWVIGRPQAEVVRTAEAGLFRGAVLDVGCGTGDNALHLAGLGHEVLGVDIAPRAIEIARAKARTRGLSARFEVADALDLGSLRRTFDSALDAGVFHVFDDAERPRYVASLRQALAPSALLHVIVFSDLEPADWGGPRRIRKSEIEDAFRDGWAVRSIEAARYETKLHEHGGQAWHATVERV